MILFVFFPFSRIREFAECHEKEGVECKLWDLENSLVGDGRRKAAIIQHNEQCIIVRMNH